MLFKKLFLSLSLVASLVGSSVSFANADVSWGGRFALDWGAGLVNPEGVDTTYGASLRAAELNLDVDFENSIKFSMDTEFMLKSDTWGVRVGPAFLTFEDLFSHTDLMIGNVPSPFCLTDSNSSKYLPHLERSLLTAFKPCVGPGLGLTHSQDNWALKFVAKGTSLDKQNGNDNYGAVLRATWAPLMDKGNLVHVGASASYQMMGESSTTTFMASETSGRFKSRGEAAIALAKEVSSYAVVGADVAGVMGPFSADVEGQFNFVQMRDDASIKAPMFWGLNAGLGWFITGQAREYKVKDGRFGKIDRSKHSDWGVWELAARYSHLDLATTATTDGAEATKNLTQNITGTLNWYPTEALRMAAEYVHSMKTTTDTMSQGTLVLRVQTVF